MKAIFQATLDWFGPNGENLVMDYRHMAEIKDGRFCLEASSRKCIMTALNHIARGCSTDDELCDLHKLLNQVAIELGMPDDGGYIPAVYLVREGWPKVKEALEICIQRSEA